MLDIIYIFFYEIRFELILNKAMDCKRDMYASLQKGASKYFDIEFKIIESSFK